MPTLPEKLLFPCLAENNSKMEIWLLEYSKSSTFNTCPHQPLPSMSGPPIHGDEIAKPSAIHTATPVPLHCQEKVKFDLLQDEALGVMEKVPYGEPTKWCLRMVITGKHDGSPRRTVGVTSEQALPKRNLLL